MRMTKSVPLVVGLLLLLFAPLPADELPPEAQEHYDEARAILTKLAKSQSQLSAREQRQMQQQALGELQKAHAIAPEHDSLSYDLGLFHYRLGEYRDAIKVLKPLVDRSPQLHEARETLGFCYARQKKFSSAEKHLEALHEANPQSLRFLNNLTVLYRSWQKWDRLIEVAERMVELKPDDTDVLMVLAEACTQAGKLDQAAQTIEQVLEGEPQRADALGMAVKVYYDARDYEKVVAHGETYLAHHAGESYARHVREMVKRAKRKLK